jgi:hypothetical protein
MASLSVRLCGCGKKDTECANYRAYGYNCGGTRCEPDGQILHAPFGFGQKTNKIGPDFGDTYCRDHPEEFEEKESIRSSPQAEMYDDYDSDPDPIHYSAQAEMYNNYDSDSD